MPEVLRFSQLSPPRQALVRLCHSINHGHIHDLHLRDREPAFTPAPIVLLDIRLDNDEGPRPEIGLVDFELSNELRHLMGRIDRIEKERVVRIEVRAGIPRRIIFQCSVTEVLP